MPDFTLSVHGVLKIPKPESHPAHTTPQWQSPLASREARLSRFVLVLLGFCFLNIFFSISSRCSPGIHGEARCLGRSWGPHAPAPEAPWSAHPAPPAQAQGGAALRPLAPGKAARVTRAVRSAAAGEVGAPAGLAGRTNALRGGAARGLPRADHRHHACRGRRALPTRGAEGSGGERRRGLPRDPWRRREARDNAARAERRGRGEKQGRRSSPEAAGALDTHCLHIAKGPSGRGLGLTTHPALRQAPCLPAPPSRLPSAPSGPWLCCRPCCSEVQGTLQKPSTSQPFRHHPRSTPNRLLKLPPFPARRLDRLVPAIAEPTSGSSRWKHSCLSSRAVTSVGPLCLWIPVPKLALA